MKKIFVLFVSIVATFCGYTFAQNNPTETQSPVLTHYLEIKDALISGNKDLATLAANQFINAVNATNTNVIPKENKMILLKDANEFSKATDLKKQRGLFASFSNDMFDLAKISKLSSDVIYKSYCPMKKASWLSDAAVIKNPYYGKAMLNCGKVVETIK